MSRMFYVTIHVPQEKMNLVQNVFNFCRLHFFKNEPNYVNSNLDGTFVTCGPVSDLISKTLTHQAKILGLRSEIVEQSA